jgi:hypothetical protein
MILVEFTMFLAKPDAGQENLSINKKLINFIILLFCALILSYGLNIVLRLFFQAPESRVDDLSFAKLVVFGLLLAPLFEELVFRLSLLYSKLFLSISLALAISSLLTSFMDIRLLTWTGCLSFYIGLSACFIFLNNHKTAHQVIEFFWKNHFAVVFYLSTFLFGIFHMGNYDLIGIQAMALALLFCTPQVIGSLFLGFVRIRLGFLWALVMHILYNSVPFLLMIIYR